MIDTYSVALGMHLNDRLHGGAMTDVDFEQLTEEKQKYYLDLASGFVRLVDNQPRKTLDLV